MKRMKMRCLLWYSKVLAAAMAMLGFVTCTEEEPDMYGVPVMYGPLEPDSVAVDSADVDTVMVMYGVASAKFRAVEDNNVEADEKTEETMDSVLW